METRIYSSLPDEARAIRKAVFVEEQGFSKEFDEIDETARHLLLIEDGQAIATCRFYYDTALSSYLVGRIAVLKEYRGRKIGAYMLSFVADILRLEGEKLLTVHAQDRAVGFYERQGFVSTEKRDQDEGCPHTWMQKKL